MFFKPCPHKKWSCCKTAPFFMQSADGVSGCERGYAWGGKPHTVRFSSPNPTFSTCCGCGETFIPLGLRGRDSTITWLRQYQYNLHSPLQPPVVKALLLVLRSSAALALAAVAPLCVAQFIRIRTARSPRRGSQPVCKSTACRLQASPHPHPFKTSADCKP